uniref:Uncharacterized protein n=1 Tax=Pavo cristatus TaxID=9049 RepID=A0A8C9L8M9_PAVCR
MVTPHSPGSASASLLFGEGIFPDIQPDLPWHNTRPSPLIAVTWEQRPTPPSPQPPFRSLRDFSSESPGFSQPPRLPPEASYGKLRPVRAAPPPPTQQHHRRPTEKIEDVEITLV